MPKAQEKINSSAPRPVSIFRVQLYVKNWAWNVKFHLVERDNTPHHHSSMTSVDREQNAPSDAELLEDLQGEVFMNFHHTVRACVVFGVTAMSLAPTLTIDDR